MQRISGNILLLTAVSLSILYCFGLSMTSTTGGPLEETSDRLNRWHLKWADNKLGWHQKEAHPSLLTYGQQLVTDDKKGGGENDSCPTSIRWFVPLCGKTVDMAYLASQEATAEVVGVDGIRRALDEFAKEHPDLQFEAADSSGGYERLAGKQITLLKGDFFALDAELTGGRFDAVMDRASMVAIDPSLREDYVHIISRLVKPGGKILLVTIEKRTGKEEAVKKGPPFSVSESEVRRLYEGQDWVHSVTLLEEIDEFEVQPDSRERFEGDGVTSMYELYFLIKTKS